MKSTIGNFIILLCAVVLPLLYKIYIGKIDNLEPIDLVLHHFQVTIPIYIRYTGPKFYFPDLIQAAQIQVDAECLGAFPEHWKLILIEESDVNTPSNQEYIVEMIYHHEDSVGLASEELKAYLFYTLESIHNNDLPFILAQTIIYHLLKIETSMIKSNLVQAQSMYLEISIDLNNCLKLEMEKLLEKYLGLITYSFIDSYSGDVNFTSRLYSDENGVPSSPEASITSYNASELEKLDQDIKQALNIPFHENIDYHLASLKRILTLKLWKKIAQNLNKDFDSNLVQRLNQLITHVSQNPTGDWTNFLMETKIIYNQFVD